MLTASSRYDEVQSREQIASFDSMIEVAADHYERDNFAGACEQLRESIGHYDNPESMMFLGKLLKRVALEKTGDEKDVLEKEAIGWLRKAAYKHAVVEAGEVLFELYWERQPFYGNPRGMGSHDCDGRSEESDWNHWAAAKSSKAADFTNTRW